MFKIKTITLSLLALLLVMSFASCASDTTSDLPLPSKDMKAYLQEHEITDVLVLYNVSNFISDRNIHKLTGGI